MSRENYKGQFSIHRLDPMSSDRMLKIGTVDNEDRGELFTFFIREKIEVMVIYDKAELFSPPRKRREPFKESP